VGYNPGLLDLFVEWFKKYGFGKGTTVLDIGTSELFCADDPDSLNRFLRHFGATPYSGDELDRMSNQAFASELFRRAGLRYQAVDITPSPHTIRIDLNAESLPFWRRGRYWMVINSGTTEHVLNQYNAFRLIHDATAVGGLMYHGVPMAGELEHGFISYHPRFFHRLAEENGYEVLDIWGWTSESAHSHRDAEALRFNHPFVAQDAFVHVLLRKAARQAFRAPPDTGVIKAS
jgi:SAM-dependent methyltransferase